MLTYQYQKFGPHVRPVISVTLIRGNKFVETLALVDSGSDICLFNMEVAQALGIEVSPRNRHSIGGLSGVQRESFVHRIIFKLGEYEYKTKVGFMSNISGMFNYGILGQKGFFDHFDVSFRNQDRTIEIEKVN